MGTNVTNNSSQKMDETSSYSSSSSSSYYASSKKSLIKQADISQDVGEIGIYENVSYDVLWKEFKSPTNYKVSHSVNKIIVYLTLNELVDQDVYLRKALYILLSNCIAYVKVVYSPNLIRRVGKQVIFSAYSKDGVLELREYILE